jgi:Uma2 family endonuclease
MPTKVSVAADLERELLTAADFLEWLQPGRHADLIDGEVLMHSPVSVRHADVLNFVDGLLRLCIDRHDLGRLYREVVAVRLSGRNVFLPDLAFYAAGRASAARQSYLEGAPDLVVEVLSPRTAERDVGPKFAEYEQHGVREYWILDPETLAHRFYRRETVAEAGPNAPGGEELVEFANGEALIASQVVSGFFLRRGWLDPAQLPKLDEALSSVEAGPE